MSLTAKAMYTIILQANIYVYAGKMDKQLSPCNSTVVQALFEQSDLRLYS